MEKTCALCKKSHENIESRFLVPKTVDDRMKWSQVCSTMLGNSAVLCARHFTSTGQRRRLQPYSAPSRNLPPTLPSTTAKANIMMQDRLGQSDEYDEIRDIPLRKRLEILMLAKVANDRLELANRVGIPLRHLRVILKYKQVILNNWKYCPELEAHLGLNELQIVFAANQILVEWWSRARKLGWSVSDEVLLRKARYVKRLFNLRHFEATEQWLSRFKIKSLSRSNSCGQGPADITSILECLQEKLPSRVYDRFRFYLLLQPAGKEHDSDDEKDVKIENATTQAVEEHNSDKEDGRIEIVTMQTAEASAAAEEHNSDAEDGSIEIATVQTAEASAAAEEHNSDAEDGSIGIVTMQTAEASAAAEEHKSVQAAETPAAAEEHNSDAEDGSIEIATVQAAEASAVDCLGVAGSEEESDSDVEELIQPIPFIDIVDEEEADLEQRQQEMSAIKAAIVEVLKRKGETAGQEDAGSRAKRRGDSENASKDKNSEVLQLPNIWSRDALLKKSQNHHRKSQSSRKSPQAVSHALKSCSQDMIIHWPTEKNPESAFTECIQERKEIKMYKNKTLKSNNENAQLKISKVSVSQSVSVGQLKISKVSGRQSSATVVSNAHQDLNLSIKPGADANDKHAMAEQQSTFECTQHTKRELNTSDSKNSNAVCDGEAKAGIKLELNAHEDRSSSVMAEVVHADDSTDVQQEPPTSANTAATEGESMNAAADAIQESDIVLVRKKYCLELDGADWAHSGTWSREFSSHSSAELVPEIKHEKAIEITTDEEGNSIQIRKREGDKGPEFLFDGPTFSATAEVKEEEVSTDDDSETVEILQVIEEYSDDEDEQPLLPGQQTPNTATVCTAHDSEEGAQTAVILSDNAAARRYLKKLHSFALKKLDVPALMLIKQLDAVLCGEENVDVAEC